MCKAQHLKVELNDLKNSGVGLKLFIQAIIIIIIIIIIIVIIGI